MGNLALSGTVLVVAGTNLAECKSEKTPNQLLCKAAGDGNIATMKQALYSGADVNCLTSDGETAMHKACGRGHIEAMRVLVDHGFCEFNVQDDHGWTALHKATRRGHVEAIRELCKLGFTNVNAQDHDGLTAIHKASQKGHVEAMQVLVNELGFKNNNAQDKDGNTALHTAAKKRKSDAIKVLVPLSNADVKNKQGQTAMDVVLNHYENIEEIAVVTGHFYGVGTA